jgi:undecaprenyl-diphosphatase
MKTPRMLIYLGACTAAALLGAFGLVADEVVEGDALDFDRSILLALRVPGNPSDPVGPPWLEEAARDITSLGSFSVLAILVVTIVIYLWLVGKARTAWYLVVAVAGGITISSVLKVLFDRPRPDLVGVARVFTASFPSGHATLSAVVYLTLGALLAESASNGRLKIFYLASAALLAFIVGVSRVYLGVHYPTDVLAGWSIGGAWAVLCVTVAHIFDSSVTKEARSR